MRQRLQNLNHHLNEAVISTQLDTKIIEHAMNSLTSLKSHNDGDISKFNNHIQSMITVYEKAANALKQEQATYVPKFLIDALENHNHKALKIIEDNLSFWQDAKHSMSLCNNVKAFENDLIQQLGHQYQQETALNQLIRINLEIIRIYEAFSQDMEEINNESDKYLTLSKYLPLYFVSLRNEVKTVPNTADSIIDDYSYLVDTSIQYALQLYVIMANDYFGLLNESNNPLSSICYDSICTNGYEMTRFLLQSLEDIHSETVKQHGYHLCRHFKKELTNDQKKRNEVLVNNDLGHINLSNVTFLNSFDSEMVDSLTQQINETVEHTQCEYEKTFMLMSENPFLDRQTTWMNQINELISTSPCRCDKIQSLAMKWFEESLKKGFTYDHMTMFLSKEYSFLSLHQDLRALLLECAEKATIQYNDKKTNELKRSAKVLEELDAVAIHERSPKKNTPDRKKRRKTEKEKLGKLLFTTQEEQAPRLAR